MVICVHEEDQTRVSLGVGRLTLEAGDQAGFSHPQFQSTDSHVEGTASQTLPSPIFHCFLGLAVQLRKEDIACKTIQLDLHQIGPLLKRNTLENEVRCMECAVLRWFWHFHLRREVKSVCPSDVSRTWE